MSYSDADRMVYAFPAIAFSGGDNTAGIRGPRGKAGKLIRAHVHATTAFAGATTRPKLQIGKLGSVTSHMNWDLGTQAINTGQSSDDSSQTSNPISPVTGIIPADEAVLCSFISATGGGAAGVGSVEVCIDWDW